MVCESLFLDYYRGDGTALLLDDLLAPVWFVQTDIEVHACGWLGGLERALGLGVGVAPDGGREDDVESRWEKNK